MRPFPNRRSIPALPHSSTLMVSLKPCVSRLRVMARGSLRRRWTMYTLQMTAFGDPTEVVKLVELPNPPAPGGNEALVAVEYAPINASVLLTIRGLYGTLPS